MVSDERPAPLMDSLKAIPKIVHICCFALGVAYILLVGQIVIDARTPPNALTEYLLLVFFPLIGTPYLFWAIEGESRDYDKYLKEYYNDSVYFMWFIRLFMMVIASLLYLTAAFVVIGVLVSFYYILGHYIFHKI
jgi:hypothetical protein